jgi:integrase
VTTLHHPMMSSDIDPNHIDTVYYDTGSSTLRDAALSKATLRSYNNNLNKFLLYTRLSLPKLAMLHPTLIDQRLSQYIDDLFARKGSYDYASQTLFGLIYRCPRLRLSLGESRLRLRGWKRLKQHRSHPPITHELTMVFATTMAKWGRHAEAVATLLAFDCFLRVGELTRIRYHDVVMPHDPRMGSAHTGMVVRLARAKTGLNQSVSLDSAQVQRALHHYLLAHPFLDTDRIFAFSPSSFRTLIKDVSTSLGLGEIPYVPHSFRHGGATYFHQRGATIEQIMYRGRWVALESARRYIQTARALLIMLSIPSGLNETGRVLAPHIDVVLGHLLATVPSAAKQDRRVWFRVDL